MTTFRRLLGFLGPYRRGVVVSCVLAAAAMVMTVAIPWLTGRAVEAVTRGDRDALWMAVGGIGVAAVLRLGLTVARRLIAGQVSLGVEVDLRNRLYAHLQRLELGFFDRQQTGQLMSRSTVDLQSVRFFLGYGLIFILQSALTIALAAVAMFALQPGLAAIALAPVPFVVLVAQRYGRRSRPALQEVQQRIAELTADAEENISGVRVVKAFAREDQQLEGFRHSVARVFDQSVLSTRLRAFYAPAIGFLPNLGLAAILFFGGRAVIDGSLDLGAFTSFYLYLLMLIGPMRTLGFMLGSAQRATASGARIFELLDRDPRIVEAPGAPALPAGDGRVELRDVSLSFEGATEPALRDVDLVVDAGTTLALVGTTGSGKSSLTSLIPRLYDVSGGAVLIDGADVRDVDVASLRGEIALVTDDPFLFSASVHENIAYADAGASRERVEEAARRAQADRFIRALPEGYDTRVGERGLTLSGGQRQRIAIARALLANPRILILDDATSSVDASTEQEIKEALREVMAGRTTFVIAHRLSTIALADEIAVLERGRLVAHGDHADLLEASPLYSEIVEKGVPEQVFLTRAPLDGGEGDARNGAEPHREGHERRDEEERDLDRAVRAATLRSERADRATVLGRGSNECRETADDQEDRANGAGRNGSQDGPNGRTRDGGTEDRDGGRTGPDPRSDRDPASRDEGNARRRLRSRSDRARKLRGVAVLLRPYRWRLIAMTAALLAATAASLAPPPLAKLAIDDGITPGNVRALDLIVVAFVISAVVVWAATYVQTYLVGWVGQRALQELRLQVFEHLQSLSIGFYSRNRAGVLISRLTNDVQALDQLVTDGVVTLFQASLTLIGTLVILLLIDVKLALLTFLIFPVLLGASFWFRIASAGAYRLTREKIAWITAYLQETLSGIRVVRAFGQERRHIARFEELNEENREANMRTVYLNAVYFPGIELASAFAIVGILLYGGNQAIDGAVTVAVIVAFVAALNNFFDPIQQLSQLYTTFQSGMAALDKIFALLDEQPDIRDRPGAVELSRIRGAIDFDRVSFRYTRPPGSSQDEAPAWALRDVDLHIPPGQTVALVGETGAGKSTLAKLVSRFYDPTEGAVRVDGHDLRDVTARSLREQMGIVPQEAFLFSGTLRDNIGFARSDATDEEVRAAARAVGADGFIEEYPDGYDTQVGERGVQLSAGQRQLVAFARALVADPRILVLDEATSNVDIHTETTIENGLRRLLAGRTSIVIAHRLSTIRTAGRIIVLDQGGIVEQGTHAELLEAGGAYWSLYRDWAEQAAA